MKKLPEGWKYPKIEDIFTILKGNGLSKNKIVKNGKNKCILYGELYTKYNEVIHEVISRTNEENGIKSKSGDILIPASTTTTGKDLANAVALNEDNVLLGGDINIFRMKKNNIDSIFMAHYLTHIKKREIANLTQGSTIIHLYGKNMKHLHIHLPPLEEQKKIAEILSTVDNKISIIDNQIEQKKLLKKGLMQKLLTQGIGHSDFKDSEVGRIPKNWEVYKFKEITKVRQGLQIPISKRKKEKCKNCYQYITIQFIKNNKEIEYIENPQKSVICNENDILMTRTGNTGIVITNVNGVFHNNFFLIDFDREKISKEYLVYYLNSYNIQKEIILKAGATTIPDLNHSDFYSIRFVMPPLQEQKQIAKILSTTDEKLENLKEKKKSFEKLKKGLMQKLLTGEVRV